jgi:Putative exonuclease, RdgC
MGVYSNTVSFAQFRVLGDLPAADRFAWISGCLKGRIFRSIEQSAEEVTEGWTCTDRPDDPEFESPSTLWRDRYLFFTYRRDQRRIPAAVYKSHVGRAEGEYLGKRPELKRPPKREREEIKERVKLSLLARVLPAPATVDLVWNADEGLLTLFSASPKVFERFEELFGKSFEHLRPQLIYPYARCMALLDEKGKGLLAAANQAGSDSALDEIQSNRWLGEDFLLWLLHRGLDDDGGFSVATPGPYKPKEPFTAWIDDRIQLQGGGDGGPQKVTVSGSQDRYLEARSALKSGKGINSAAIYLEKDELQWRFVLNAELFSFGSFRSPQVRIEREGVEELSEREGAFYERIYLIEAGLQLFDSLLVAFLKERLDKGWQERQQLISDWLVEEKS